MTSSLKVVTNTDPPSGVSADLEQSFAVFWQIYPRKEGKAIAKAKFLAICRPQGLATRTTCRDSGQIIYLDHQASPEAIIEGAKRFRRKFINSKLCRSDDYANPVWNDDIRFCPYAATWLNRGGWDDD